MIWHYSRADKILEHWAENNGYEIVSKELRWFRRGPFFWWTSRGQEVYFVKVRGPDGEYRRGWVRCGNWLLGMFVDEAEARWNE